VKNPQCNSLVLMPGILSTPHPIEYLSCTEFIVVIMTEKQHIHFVFNDLLQLFPVARQYEELKVEQVVMQAHWFFQVSQVNRSQGALKFYF
jgi:hypothetical protein